MARQVAVGSLPDRVVDKTHKLVVQGPTGTGLATIEQIIQTVPGLPSVITPPSQTEAEAGTDNTKPMTPLRVAQANTKKVATTNLQLSGNLTYSGTAGGTFAKLDSTTVLFGTATVGASGFVSPHSIYIGGDTAKVNDFLDGLNVTHAIGGAGNAGGRHAIHSRAAVVGQVNPGTGSANRDVVSLLSDGYSTANQGGTGTFTSGHVDDGYIGALWGGHDNIWLGGSATFYRGLYGREIKVSCFAGTSTFAKIGLLFTLGENDAVNAVEDDAGIAFGCDQDTSKWKRGINFGLSWGYFPFGANSTLIGATVAQYPSPIATPTVKSGIDLSGINFTDYALRFPGFAVNGTGNITATPAASATPTVNGQMTFELTSNTQLKIKVKGSDGAVRSVSLTLA